MKKLILVFSLALFCAVASAQVVMSGGIKPEHRIQPAFASFKVPGDGYMVPSATYLSHETCAHKKMVGWSKAMRITPPPPRHMGKAGACWKDQGKTIKLCPFTYNGDVMLCETIHKSWFKKI